MSTNDVPGAVPSNNDELKMGCWAEHDDGSMIFVKSTEGDRVIYEMFDTSQDPIVVYTDAMPLKDFEKKFSYDPKILAGQKWVWHDKTPMPWNKVIKAGARDGLGYASAADQLAAAARVAQSLGLAGKPIDPDQLAHLADKSTLAKDARTIIQKLQSAINTLPVDKVAAELKQGEEDLKKLTND
jgi:hypothetical protein